MCSGGILAEGAADSSPLRAASPSESAAKVQADLVIKLLATVLNGPSVFRSSAPNFFCGGGAATWDPLEIPSGGGQG